MLGDATRLVRRHVGGAQRVEQRGLAVVDVAHDGDHRRPRDPRVVGIGRIGQAGLDVAFGDALEPVTHLRHHQLGGVGIDHLVDGGHHAHAHQRLDHVGAALGHARGELLDRDGLGNRDLAIDLLLRLVGVLAAALALETAALLRHRPAAEIVLALDRATHVDLVGAALRSLTARTRRCRRTLGRCQGRTHRRTTQRAGTGGGRRRRTRRAAHDGRTARIRGRQRRPGRADLLDLTGHRRLRRRTGLVHALLDERIGLALDLVLGLLARLFLGEALPVLLLGRGAHLLLGLAALGVLGRTLARDLGVAIGVDQRPGAGDLFFFRQRAQHDAATAGLARTSRKARSRSRARR